jgi:hypothetical protein
MATHINAGSSSPLGATATAEGVNFSLFEQNGLYCGRPTSVTRESQ